MEVSWVVLHVAIKYKKFYHIKNFVEKWVLDI